jgi:mannitol-1-phosphate/altronate dehydrogenase
MCKLPKVECKEEDHVIYTSSQKRHAKTENQRNIMFCISGSIDPWHALSVLGDESATEIAIYITGTAHCANMSSGKPGDPQSLKDARTVSHYSTMTNIYGSIFNLSKENYDCLICNVTMV